jgi:predicted DNA-binding transcriptional regulator AlpA
MELNEDLFRSHGLHQNLKKAYCPRRGLSRQEAALYIGVSASLFDDLVKSGEMPKPLRIKRRTVWDRHQLDECFEALSVPDENPWDELDSGRERW